MSLAAQISERLDELLYEHAETKRKFACIIRTGIVKSFKPEDNTAVVDIGFDTHDVPVFNQGGTGKHWHPLKKGQQVTLLCSDGDIANAVIIPGGYHDKNPQPSKSADEDLVAQRGADASPVHMRSQDKHIAFENHAGKSAVRARDAGIVHVKVTSLDKFKIVVGNTQKGETAWRIKPEALIQTDLDTEGLPA